MLILTILINLGVTGILCNIRLVLERKKDKEISELSRLSFSANISANNLALLGADDKTSRLLNRRGIEAFAKIMHLLLKAIFNNKF